MIKKSLIAVAAAAMMAMPAVGAEQKEDGLRYEGEIGATFSTGDHAPFWMVNDQYGFSSLKRNNAWLRAGIFHDMDTTRRFTWGAGVDFGVAVNFQRVFIPQQIYGEVKYRCLNAMLGQKEMRDDIIDSELSSGGMTVSGNARPIPQLRLGIFDYADVWGCKGWFAVKGYIGYGMFTDSKWIERYATPQMSYTTDVLYCTRAIYFKFGDRRQFPLVGEIGMRMDSQFGGTQYSAENAEGLRRAYQNPTDFKAWIKGLIPLGGGSDTTPGEQLNVQGNFLGNWTFALGWYDPSGWSVKAYYQHFFEDHSMMTFDYAWKDGFWGVQGILPRNPFLTEAVVEFLYSKDQGGPVYFDHTPDLDIQVSGRDWYYNNYIYTSWSNYGMGIGNPLIISPLYNSPRNLFFQHTRVEAFNMGLRGNPSKRIDWTLRLSNIRSWGTYDTPTDKVRNDFSLLAKVNWHPERFKGWNASLSVGWDSGNLIGNNFGIGISISKTGFIKF